MEVTAGEDNGELHLAFVINAKGEPSDEPCNFSCFFGCSEDAELFLLDLVLDPDDFVCIDRCGSLELEERLEVAGVF